MMEIMYRKLEENEITVSLFETFNRYQNVEKCWRKENGEWQLKDITFVEQWGINEYRILTTCLRKTMQSGGSVFGAFHENSLVGFASLEVERFGPMKEYLQLSSLHTSYDCRGHGIGKALFSLVKNQAMEMEAKKIYISAHSSQETQAFYHAIGCVEAVEYNKSLVEAEPCDCQLEYVLER